MLGIEHLIQTIDKKLTITYTLYNQKKKKSILKLLKIAIKRGEIETHRLK